MINSATIQQRSPYLRILTDDQICEIKRSALDVMFNVGFKVPHAGARNMLKQAGAIVTDEFAKVPEFIQSKHKRCFDRRCSPNPC